MQAPPDVTKSSAHFTKLPMVGRYTYERRLIRNVGMTHVPLSGPWPRARGISAMKRKNLVLKTVEIKFNLASCLWPIAWAIMMLLA